jgi:hypothetical protein
MAWFASKLAPTAVGPEEKSSRTFIRRLLCPESRDRLTWPPERRRREGSLAAQRPDPDVRARFLFGYFLFAPGGDPRAKRK